MSIYEESTGQAKGYYSPLKTSNKSSPYVLFHALIHTHTCFVNKNFTRCEIYFTKKLIIYLWSLTKNVKSMKKV